MSEGSPRATLVLAEAARVILTVIANGRAADEALVDIAGESTARAAVQAVAIGSLRWYLRLAPLVHALVPRRPDPRVGALLVAALHQLEYSRHAPQTVVAAAVDASRTLGVGHAAGLVNAVLRRFLRERERWQAWLEAEPDRALAYPGWLLAALERAWPGEGAAIARAGNGHPPMVLRVNLARTARTAYLERLTAAGIAAEPIEALPGALRLHEPRPVQQLPGFDDGDVSVQDGAAQLAALLLAPRSGERVLDACAAPGGKCAALLEQYPGIELWALDVDRARLALLEEGLVRLHQRAHIVRGDLADPAAWWDGRRFDHILLDAPCSATGVIRRHPDIKLLRRAEDIGALAATQRRLLASALGLLAAGGRVLYCTCSVLPEENEAVVSAVLAEHPGVRVERCAVPALLPVRELAHGWQLLPADPAATDGFYYACLRVA